MKYSLFAFYLVLTTAKLGSQTTITVVNSNNSGSGSLRQALITAITSANDVTINFQSSITNITLLSSIDIQNNKGRIITINGQGRVKLKGTGNRSINGFQIKSGGSVYINGLYFENFISGIVIYSYAVIRNNVFAKNSIGVLAVASSHIYENYIGTDQNYAANIGNDDNIVVLSSGIEINDNTICSATKSGISGTGSGYIYNNTIGTNLIAGLGNKGNAIKLSNGHFAISNNSIIGNGGGIITNKSELRKNTFLCNDGIPFTSSSPYAKPIVTSLKYNQNGSVSIVGTSNAAGDYIEIFQSVSSSSCPNAACQGESIANTTANATKQWSATFTPKGSEIFVTASTTGDLQPPFEGTTFQGSTSLFTDCQIPQCPNVAISLQAVNPVYCYGGNDGSAKLTITPTGSGGQYEYTVTQTNIQPNVTSNPKTIVLTDTIRSLKSGTYRVTVRNKLTNCTYISTNTITITQPNAPLSMSACKELSPVTAANNDAVGQVVVSGGTAPYSLNVTRPNGTTFTIPYQTSGTFNIPNLSPGIYKVNAFDGNYPNGKPNTGCFAACTFTINTANCKALKLTVKTVMDVLCQGDSMGYIVVQYNDLTTNFPLTLTTDNGFSLTINAFSSDSTAIIPRLKAANYTITLKNKSNCTTTTSATIDEPPALKVTCDTVIATKRVGEASGVAKVSLNGGQATYSLVVSGPVSSNYNSATATQITFNNLAKGNYIATVYDRYQCFDTCRFTILEPNCTGFNVTPTIDTIQCFGEKNGSIILSTVNGISPITYTWNNTAIGNQNVANNLDVGTYRVTITDDRNCKDTVVATIITPSVLTTNLTITNVQVVGQSTGKIAVSVSGGTPNYMVVLTSSGNIVPLSSQNGNVFNFNNLPKGTYIATTTDANGCAKIDTVRITDPDCNFEINIQQVKSVSCYGGNDGLITLTHNSPGVGVNYFWSQTGIGNTATATGLRAGIYSVTATTLQNCKDSLDIPVSQSDSLIVFSTPFDASTVGGSEGRIEVKVNGGTQPYTVRRGATNATRIDANSFVFNGLSAGSYTFTVTDNNGCSTSQTVTIRNPNCNMVISAQVDSVLCKSGATGSITVTVNNGINPLAYAWTPPSVNTTNTANNLAAGTYSVTVTDARRCTISTRNTVFEPLLALTANGVATAVTIINDGKIDVTVRGGTKPYTLAMAATNATRLTDTTFVFKDLAAGSYTFTATDKKGCTTSQTVTVGSPNCNINAQINITQAITCFGVSDGGLNVIAQNAQTPQYRWSINLGNTANPTGLAAGSYAVTVTDARGCSATAQTTLTAPAQIRASVFGDTTVCVGQSAKLRFAVLNTNTFSLTFTNGRDTFRTNLLEATVTPSATAVYQLLSVQSGSCKGLVTNNNRVTVQLPNEKANAGADKIECNAALSSLSASVIVNQGITGRWTALDGGVLVSPTTVTTSVSNLNIGVNRFVWVLSSAVCSEISRDTVVISVVNAPELATTQQINLDSKLTTVLVNTRQLLKNQTTDPSVFTLKILKFPDKSRVEIRDIGIHFDRNDLTEAQTVEIEFEICNKSCPNQCSKGKMLIVLQPLEDDTGLSIPKIFSVNDRSSTTLDINGLDFFLENEITIVNRWGAVVFGPVSYKNNTPERSWDGKRKGQSLPTGAYYYFIRYKEKDIPKIKKDIWKIKKGIIYLVEEL